MSRNALSLTAIVALLFGSQPSRADVKTGAVSSFTVTHQVVLPGPPETIYDAFTGDIKPWWDHSWTENPKALYIEPRAGGGFYEVFDDSGNGALHATVITASRGKILRMDGPLGLAAEGIEMVHSLTFEQQGSDSTSLSLVVHATGLIPDWAPGAVDKVWQHFLIERFKPYVESGGHRSKVSSAK